MKDVDKQGWVRRINLYTTDNARYDYVQHLVDLGVFSSGEALLLLIAARDERGASPSGPFIGPVQEVAQTPPPKAEPSLCACGAEFMGQAKAWRMCGDCSMTLALPGRPRASLDQRIAEAQPPKVDKDPTEAWTAGATANWEWP